jgi:heat-inducible transcriptional repressor
VKDAHLIPIGTDEVLLVVVTGSGNVNQALLGLGAPATPAEVGAAGDAIAARLVGEVLGGEDGLDRGEVTGLPPAALDIFDRALDAIDSAAVEHPRIYVGGASWMATLWEDLAQLQRILGVLDREAGVLGLVGGDDPGTSVRLGTELPAGEEDLAVVSSSYEASGGSGRMGVFGPMRMNYRRAIRVVEEVSDALGDSLGD